MSNTVLRLGLWTLIIVLGLYVLTEAYNEQQWTELVSARMLQQAFVLSIVLIVAGAVLRIFGVGVAAVSKNRCKTCRAPIPSGAMYCREHLRQILHEEDERTHMTKIRRR